MVKNDVEQAFTNLKTGLVSPEQLQKQLSSLTKEQIQTKLQAVDAYTLNRPARRNFERRRVYVSGINDQFQADLADVSNLSKQNDNNKFLLVVIDVFSKHAWVIPIKHKTAAEVVEAFETIFTGGRIPNKIQTDDGKEFFNSSVKALFDKYNINHFSTNNETKASIVERFNRILKKRMYTCFVITQSFRYVDDLQKLVENYNNTKHSSIKMAPNEVNDKNEIQVRRNLYGDELYADYRTPKLDVKDYVRISNAKHIFDKGYEGNWTIEVFKISEVLKTQPPTYRIVDLLDEEVTGSFYEEELQKVAKPKSFRIEKVLKQRKSGKINESYVKWLGYDERFNSWIPTKNIE